MTIGDDKFEFDGIHNAKEQKNIRLSLSFFSFFCVNLVNLFQTNGQTDCPFHNTHTQIHAHTIFVLLNLIKF